MTEYRASFDASVTFANGGGLSVQAFRVDVPSADVDQAGIAALFVASLGLLMTESVELSDVEIFAEPHEGTRGGPSDRSASPPSPGGTLVELSHVIRAGMITYPGLPGPEITPHLTREASRGRYAPGTEFTIGGQRPAERHHHRPDDHVPHDELGVRCAHLAPSPARPWPGPHRFHPANETRACPATPVTSSPGQQPEGCAEQPPRSPAPA
jgi:hypothetical protein